MSQPRGTAGRARPRWREAGAALLALVAGACTSAGAHVYNLEQLHTDDGHHRFSAVQMGGFEYEFRSGMRTLLPKSAVAMQQKEPRAIDDPLELCLENLVDLQGVSSQDPHDASLKVQCFARWAVEDPWQLSRERCLLALQHEAERLELRSHPPGLLEGEPVGPDELADGLAQLTSALRSALTESVRPDRAALDAACARIRGFEYDLDGARRATSFVALLARQAPRDDADFEALHELHLELQRRTVDRALVSALEDRSPFESGGSHTGWGSPRVRATALRMYVRAYGPAVLGQFLAGRMRPGEDPEVLVGLLRAVREVGGLPLADSGIPVEERATWEKRWLDSIVGLAASHPEGRVRVAAMQTLAVISAGELESLREEDWLAWLKRRRVAQDQAGPAVEVEP